MAKSTLEDAFRFNKKLMGSFPREMFGAATADWITPTGAGVEMGVGDPDRRPRESGADPLPVTWDSDNKAKDSPAKDFFWRLVGST